MKTVRQVLKSLCRGKADTEVPINRRALRHLVAIAETAETYLHAEQQAALLLVCRPTVAPEDGAAHDKREREEARKARAARAELLELLRVLEVPA